MPQLLWRILSWLVYAITLAVKWHVNVQLVAIQRFDETLNPFPQANHWEVAERPEHPLCYGMSIYLAQYGVVMLQTVASTNAGWMIFQCIDVNSSVQAEIAVLAKWYMPVPWYARLLAYCQCLSDASN